MDRVPPLQTIRDKALDTFNETDDLRTRSCAAVLWHVANADLALEILDEDGGEMTIDQFLFHIGQYVLMFAHHEL